MKNIIALRKLKLTFFIVFALYNICFFPFIFPQYSNQVNIYPVLGQLFAFRWRCFSSHSLKFTVYCHLMRIHKQTYIHTRNYYLISVTHYGYISAYKYKYNIYIHTMHPYIYYMYFSQIIFACLIIKNFALRVCACDCIGSNSRLSQKLTHK